MQHPFLEQKGANPLTHLNIGCGKITHKNWLNVDKMLGPAIDIQAQLGYGERLPLDDNRFTSIYLSHTLEHIHDPLIAMEELHRVARPDCLLYIRVPYGSSDVAYEDPTHYRQYFLQSFGYFSQASYGGADYGYRGDWATQSRMLILKDHISQAEWGERLDDLLQLVDSARNVVDEMHTVLRCVKPIRIPGTFVEQSGINFKFLSP